MCIRDSCRNRWWWSCDARWRNIFSLKTLILVTTPVAQTVNFTGCSTSLFQKKSTLFWVLDICFLAWFYLDSWSIFKLLDQLSDTMASKVEWFICIPINVLWFLGGFFVRLCVCVVNMDVCVFVFLFVFCFCFFGCCCCLICSFCVLGLFRNKISYYFFIIPVYNFYMYIASGVVDKHSVCIVIKPLAVLKLWHVLIL